MSRVERSKRQTGWFVFFLGGLLFVGDVVAVVVNWPLPVDEVFLIYAASAIFWGVLYFLGFTRRVLVTPRRVRLLGFFTRVDIPREIVAGVDIDVEMEEGGLLVRTPNGPQRVMVPMIIQSYRGSPAMVARRLRRDASELTEMLDDVPATAGSGDEMRSRIRFGNVVLAVLLVADAIGSARLFAAI
jgi:hypothetical protein